MTRYRNVKLGIFRQYENTKTIFKKRKIWDRIVLRNFQNFKNLILLCDGQTWEKMRVA